MVFGNAIYSYRDPEDFLRNRKSFSIWFSPPICLLWYSVKESVPASFTSLLVDMFAKDTTKRPGPMELMKHPFLAEAVHLDIPIALEIMSAASPAPSPVPSRRPLAAHLPPTTPTKSAITAETNIFDGQTLSRYKVDFEETDFLGKGGFGEVVKARNRIGNSDPPFFIQVFMSFYLFQMGDSTRSKK